MLWYAVLSQVLILLAIVSQYYYFPPAWPGDRQARAQPTGDGARNYQAIQDAKKQKGGDRKKQTAEKTKNVDSSFVVYEIVKDGVLKFVNIIYN